MEEHEVTDDGHRDKEKGRDAGKRRPRGETESVHFHYKVPPPDTEIRGTTETSLQRILSEGSNQSRR